MLLLNHHEILRNDKRKKQVSDEQYKIIEYSKLLEFFENNNSNVSFCDEFKKSLKFHSTDHQNRAYEIAIKRFKDILLK